MLEILDKKHEALAHNILCDIAEILDFWLKTPVPFVFGKQFVLVKESRIR